MQDKDDSDISQIMLECPNKHAYELIEAQLDETPVFGRMESYGYNLDVVMENPSELVLKWLRQANLSSSWKLAQNQGLSASPLTNYAYALKKQQKGWKK